MSASFANITPTNLELSPMRVSLGGVDLGASLGNVSVSIEYTKAPIKADQFGDSVLDMRNTGLKITVTTELAEIKNKDILKTVFPNMSLVDGGLAGKAGYFVSKVGESDLSLAQQLVLHPLSNVDADKSGDYTFFKATADGKSSIVYGPTEQARLKVMWNIYPDTSVLPAKYLFIGDTTIGLVNAVAGSPVRTGTGNGTMTSVAVVNGITKTETITALCVAAAANSGTFAVSGSVSGPLGIATVGVGFSSSVISFLINDGATDFVVGDQFTVATTAANYA